MLDICLTTSPGKSLTKIYAHTGGNSLANDLARLFAQLFPLVCAGLKRIRESTSGLIRDSIQLVNFLILVNFSRAASIEF